MSPRSDDDLSADESGTARARDILAAWWSGWRAALGMPGILILKWSVNLTFAAAAVLPAALLLSDHLADSAIGFTLRRGTKTLVLWLLLVVPAPALTALLATTSVAVETTGAMYASVALGQALLLLRILGSFAALGGQMRFMPRAQRA